MSSNNLQIGMSMDKVTNLAKKANISKEVKTLIFDFCNKDIDKTISNKIELHMLNTWFSGQTKIKMPDVKTDNFFVASGKAFAAFFGADYVMNNSFKTASQKQCVSINIFHNSLGGDFNDSIDSALWDNDNDGFADTYISTSWSYKKNETTGSVNMDL